ncbi:MAG: hypothetical protein ABWY93_09120 [Mycobacterium sp.]
MNSQTSPQSSPQPRHRHRRPGKAKQLALFTALPACAAAAAVWGLADLVADHEATPVAAQQAPAAVPAVPERTVQTVGQVVAISPESITTRGTDGTTTTFAITPATTQINTGGPAAFSVDETVTVLGVVNNGTPVATALAEQDAAVGTAPPMDGV